MRPAWTVTHSRWPDDRVLGTSSRREVPDDATMTMFRLSDDDGVIYYHGWVAADDPAEGDIACEELYRWGGYYAGTTCLYLYNPDDINWEVLIA